MDVTQAGQGTRHQAPVPHGPLVEVLLGADGDAALAVAHLEIPPGGGMPEHDHGPSAALVIVERGRIRLAAGGREATLEPGCAARLAAGERVSVANPGHDPAVLYAVFAPADFAATLATWPTPTVSRPGG
jgi:quercetin dioxygenase-like cupin family protein